MTILSIAIEKLLDTDVDKLRSLAQEIWHAHFPTILSTKQIEYMLDMMYGPGVVEREMRCTGIFYDKVSKDSELVGYISYGPEGKENSTHMKLHKCYLSPSMHGFGYGQMMLEHVCNKGREMGCSEIILNVNKSNKKAIKAYHKFGFRMIASETKDIGCGYVMDDYVMGYRI